MAFSSLRYVLPTVVKQQRSFLTTAPVRGFFCFGFANNQKTFDTTKFVIMKKSEDEEKQKNQLIPTTNAKTGISALLGGVALCEGGAAGASALNPLLVTALKILPPGFFFMLQIAGLKTVKTIKQNKSVGDLPVLPFLSLATNCFVWSAYGLLTQDPTVLYPNLSGLAFGLYYTFVYTQYTKTSVLPQILGGASIAGGVLALATSLPVDQAAPYIGYIGDALAVILMASPLATMGTVIREKSTASMPFATSVATFFNAASWSGYGILIADNPLIWGPNVLGLVAACAQLALFARYGIQTPKSS